MGSWFPNQRPTPRAPCSGSAESTVRPPGKSLEQTAVCFRATCCLEHTPSYVLHKSSRSLLCARHRFPQTPAQTRGPHWMPLCACMALSIWLRQVLAMALWSHLSLPRCTQPCCLYRRSSQKHTAFREHTTDIFLCSHLLDLRLLQGLFWAINDSVSTKLRLQSYSNSLC